MCRVQYGCFFFSSSLISLFPGMLLRHRLTYFELPYYCWYHFYFHIPHVVKIFIFQIFQASYSISSNYYYYYYYHHHHHHQYHYKLYISCNTLTGSRVWMYHEKYSPVKIFAEQNVKFCAYEDVFKSSVYQCVFHNSFQSDRNSLSSVLQRNRNICNPNLAQLKQLNTPPLKATLFLGW
jgi:hypothetical protein